MSENNNTIPQLNRLDKDFFNQDSIESTTLAKDGYVFNAETDPARFPVESFNTLSNFIFLLIIIYWIRKTKFRTSLYPVLVVSLPFLFVAFISSTMHHALRSEKVWHHIDMLSIFYAVIMVCVYFWYRITHSWFKAFFFVIAIPVIFRMFLGTISAPDKISVSVVFVVMALAIFIPAIIHCIMNHLKNVALLLISSIAFAIALCFREADANLGKILPYGTHFLWHIFGYGSVFSLMQYIFLTDKAKNFEIFTQAASKFKK